jgi:hypothetical protein
VRTSEHSSALAQEEKKALFFNRPFSRWNKKKECATQRLLSIAARSFLFFLAMTEGQAFTDSDLVLNVHEIRPVSLLLLYTLFSLMYPEPLLQRRARAQAKATSRQQKRQTAQQTKKRPKPAGARMLVLNYFSVSYSLDCFFF